MVSLRALQAEVAPLERVKLTWHDDLPANKKELWHIYSNIYNNITAVKDLWFGHCLCHLRCTL